MGDVKTSGNWLNILNSRIAKMLVIGALAVSGGGGYQYVYGHFQGAKAALYCEGSIVSVTKGTVSYSCLNPLPVDESGAVLGLPDNIIIIAENTAPATRLNICTAVSASTACSGNAAGTNTASGIILGGAKRVLSLSETGGTLVQTLTTSGNSTGATVLNSNSHGKPYAVLAPRNYTTGKRYLNFTLQRGSGATVSGNPAATVRIQVVPCSQSGVGC